MSVGFKSPLSSANTNAAFVSKLVDSISVAKLTLNKVSEGTQVTSVQKAINKAFEGVGTTGENDTTINNYSSSNYVTNGDNRKVAVGKLDTKLFTTQTQVTDHETRITNIDNNTHTFSGNKTFANNVTVNGDLTINGATTSVSSVDLDVVDKNITVNKNGSDATSEGGGLTIDRVGTKGSFIYKASSATKFAIGDVGLEVNVVGTTSTQTLTNKTLTTPIVDVFSTTEQGLTPSNPPSGTRKLYSKSDGFYQLTSGGVESKIGTGSSGGAVNLITNGDAEASVVSIFTPYANAAQRLPVTGTGGAPTVTTSITSTNPLTDNKSFLLTKTAVNSQGQGWSVPFSVPLSMRAKVLQIDIDYIVNSGTFVAGSASVDSDVIWYLFDITNSQLIEPSSIKLLSNSSTLSDKFRANFQTSATGSSYRLIAHVATATASAFELKCEVAVTPTTYVYGTPITDWQPYTPTIAGWGPGNSSEGTFYRILGDSMEIKSTIIVGTSQAVIASLSLPPGRSIDASKNATTANTNSHGVIYSTSGAGNYPNTSIGPFVSFSDTSISANVLYMSIANSGSRFDKALGTSFGSTLRLRIHAIGIPILGLSSSVQMSDQTDTRIVAAKYSTTSTTAMTSSATTITHGILGFDTHGAMSGSTYTVPVSGIYKIGGSIQLASASWSTGILALDCYVNAVFAGGVAYFTQATASAGTAVITALGNNLFNLKVGDLLTFRGSQTQGGSINLSGSSNYNYVNIERLTGPSAIAATESISVIYGNGTGGVIGTSYTLQNFTAKEDDSHGAWTSNNTFTAPAAGRYSISAQILTDGVTLSTTQSTSMRVYRNGSSWRLLGFARGNGATTINYFLSGSDEFKLNAGETLQIYADSSVATAQVASGGFNRVSIKRSGI